MRWSGDCRIGFSAALTAQRLIGLCGYTSAAKEHGNPGRQKRQKDKLTHVALLHTRLALRELSASSVIPTAPKRNYLAISFDFANPHRRRASLGGPASPGEHVTWLNGALGPACAGEMVRAGEFALPLYNLSRRGVLDIHRDQYVRINVLKISDGSCDRSCLRHVISGRPMMCECRPRKHQ